MLGKVVRIDGGWGFRGGTYTVVGVLPSSFRLVMPSDSGVATELDLFVPFANDLTAGPRGLYYLRTIGRMRPDTTLEQARQEVHAIGEQIQSEFPEYDATGRARNVVSLKGDAVARAAQRREEILPRTALGASKQQIALQLLMESSCSFSRMRGSK